MAARSHHYNPQVYLRQFTNPARKKELWEYDLTQGTAKKSTPKLCGCEDYYHSFQRKDGVRDDDSIEMSLGRIENRLPKLFEAVRNKQPLPMGLWCRLFAFAALQRARSPVAIHSLQNDWSGAYTRIFEMWKQMPEFDARARQDGFDPDLIRKWPIKVTANRDQILAATMSSFKKGHLAKLLSRMKWGFLCAPADKYFLTSDDPVCCWAELAKREPFGVIGPANPHVEITFPLSRRICAFGNWKSCPPELYNLILADVVDVINCRTVQNGYRFVYGPSNDFGISRLVEEVAQSKHGAK